MAGDSGQVIRERDVQGVKYLDRVLPLLKRLHVAGCERDKAGNRDLHMDQYCALILLFLFSTVVDGSADSYLEALDRAMSPQLAAVWRCCVASLFCWARRL